jgi:hypothetical protein
MGRAIALELAAGPKHGHPVENLRPTRWRMIARQRVGAAIAWITYGEGRRFGRRDAALEKNLNLPRAAEKTNQVGNRRSSPATV